MRLREGQRIVIQLPGQSRDIHAITGEERVKEFERKRKEEEEKIKARLVIKGLEVGLQWTDACSVRGAHASSIVV